MADITINDLTEVSSAADSDFIAIDDGSATKKISVENFNATGAASAARSAAAAAQSAADASDYKDAANQAKSDTQDLITSAQTIVSDASDYASSAQTSANTATGAASTATSKASQAADSAALAAGYAANVDNFAKEAKSWAVGGTGTRSGEDTDNAKYYANEAHDSEINAAASESNASTSETNAAASESNASASASSASTNALKAEGYAVGTQNGTPAVSGETYYHDNAKYYKEQAASSETNAGTSETNAAASELAASGSASSAAASATLSESWAVGGTGTRSGEDTNNAKYWSDVAQGAAGGGVSTFNGRSGAVVPVVGDYAANQISFSDSEFVATDVKAAIKEVQDNVGDLDSSLKPVAKSGSYNDLTNKPTLGTAAAKNSTNAVSSGSTDLVESGAVYDIADGLNNAILGNATAIAKAYKKDDATDTTIANDDYVPFYDTSTQTMKKITTANFVGKRLPAQTLAAGSTTLTFTDSSITTNSTIKEFYSIRGVAARDAVVTNGQVVMTFKPLQTALSVYLVII